MLLEEAVPGAGVDGSQCLKITVPDGLLVPTVNAETQESTPNYVAIRSLNDLISFAEGEILDEYTVTMWSKVDGTTPLDVFRVNKGSELITFTSEWAEYTLTYYTSGISSRSVFFKKIKSLTGQNPQELIRDIKMKRAATLLQSQSYTIVEIAEMTGYPNSKYFSTAFKKYYGVTPTGYIKDATEISNEDSL